MKLGRCQEAVYAKADNHCPEFGAGRVCIKFHLSGRINTTKESRHARAAQSDYGTITTIGVIVTDVRKKTKRPWSC